MKILHVGKYYHPYRGGMETVLRNLAEGLIAAGNQVSVLVAGSDSLNRRESIRVPGASSEGTLIRAGALGTLQSQPLTLSMLPLMEGEIRCLKPDLVHLHLPNPLVAAVWSTLQGWSPASMPCTAIWYHADITRQKWSRHLVGPWLRRALSRSDGICVSSRALAEGSPVLEPWRKEVKVIPFGIDPAPWNSVEPDGKGPLLFVGRLVPYKGVSTLLHALALVPTAELDIVGGGPLRAGLEQEVEKLGLVSRVRFTGPLDEDRIADKLGSARALILPSIDASETFGLVQLEAMASGVPVVAADLPTGVREVGEPGRTCRLFRPGDAEDLATQIQALYDDPEEAGRFGARGRQRFQELFTREEMVAKLTRWYEDLLAGAPISEGIDG